MMLRVASVVVLACLVGCSDSESARPESVPSDASAPETSSPTDAGAATGDASLPVADAAPATGKLGTCTIAVDGSQYAYPPASGFGGGTAVKRNDELNVDCRVQSGPGVVQVVQLQTKGATAVGSHVFVKAGTPAGISAYSTTDVGGTATKRYAQDSGWKLELSTSSDSAVQGTATFTGKSDDGTTKDVVLTFHLKAER